MRYAYDWQVETAAELGEKIGCVVFGDFDPDTPGEEIAALGGSGRVWIISWQDDRWAAVQVAQAPGEMIQGVAADLDPTVAGDELVLVGMAEGGEESGGAGAAFAAVRESSAHWKLVKLHEAGSLIHGVTAAELLPAPGPELVLTGFDREVGVLARDAGGDFEYRVVAQLDGAGKNAAPHDDGVVVAVTDGSLLRVQPPLDGEHEFRVDTLFEHPAGLARLGSDGERVLIAADDGQLMLVEPDGSSFAIHSETQKLRGAVLANLDPISKGLEAASVGYAGDLVVHRRGAAGGWSSELVTHDAERLHHLAVGLPAGRTSSLALATAGYGGRVIVAWRQGRPVGD
ncbi:MAG: hypothetical protein DHS20C15_16530 [Planctomycetota bacterium]|nr:MAG: hypothetical protein DHS20C15_16530 [Planctomycetota bacterium]